MHGFQPKTYVTIHNTGVTHFEKIFSTLLGKMRLLRKIVICENVEN